MSNSSWVATKLAASRCVVYDFLCGDIIGSLPQTFKLAEHFTYFHVKERDLDYEIPLSPSLSQHVYTSTNQFTYFLSYLHWQYLAQ
jgi:hypothetical protein